LLELGLEAKDSSNNLVAGYIRNFPQDSWDTIVSYGCLLREKAVKCSKEND